MERAVLYGVRTSPGMARITVTGDRGLPPAAARVLRTVAGLGVTVTGVTCCGDPAALAFGVAGQDGPAVAAALRATCCVRVRLDEDVAGVALLGHGLRSAPAVVATFCEALAAAGVPLENLSVAADRVASVCPLTRAAAAGRALCEAFRVGMLAAGPADRSTPPDPCLTAPTR